MSTSLTPMDSLPMYLKVKKKGRRGRVSTPILIEFLRLGTKAAELDVEKVAPGKKPMSLYATLKNYLRLHPEIPVDVFLKGGHLVLVRTDIDEGEKDPWDQDRIDEVFAK